MPLHNVQTISQRTWKGGQCAHYESIISAQRGKGLPAYDSLRLRLHIKTDSVTSQARAVVEVWKGAWVEVHTIPGAGLKTDCKLAYRVGEREVPPVSAFADDLAELLRVAGEVLA